MALDIERIEAFAMAADAVSSVRGYQVDVDALGEQLGLTRNEARECADYLHEMGWAFIGGGPDCLKWLSLSLVGRIAIRDTIRRPKWQRWVDSHPQTMNVFWMTATAIVAGIIYTIITYYMLKPPAN